MPKYKTTTETHTHLRRVTNIHLLYLVAVGVQTIVFDAGKLITPHITLLRWIATAILAILVSSVWFISRNRQNSVITLKLSLLVLIVGDIALASFLTYITRGMASKAVLLYMFPIISAGVIRRKSALFATALLCVTAYIATAIAYFVLNFNEGYKLELYGEISFYGAMLLLSSLLIWSVIRPSKNN